MEPLMLPPGYKCDIVPLFTSGTIPWEVLNGILSGELLWLVKLAGWCPCINKDDGSPSFKLLVWTATFKLSFAVTWVISPTVALVPPGWIAPLCALAAQRESSLVLYQRLGVASGQECLVVVTSSETEVVMLPTALSDVSSRCLGDEDSDCHIVLSWIKGWSCLVAMGGCEKLSWSSSLGSERFSLCSISCVLCFLGSTIGALRCWLLSSEGSRSVYVSPNWGTTCWKLPISEEDMDSCSNGKSLESSSFILRGIMDGESWERKTLSSIE